MNSGAWMFLVFLLIFASIVLGLYNLNEQCKRFIAKSLQQYAALIALIALFAFNVFWLQGDFYGSENLRNILSQNAAKGMKPNFWFIKTELFIENMRCC